MKRALACLMLVVGVSIAAAAPAAALPILAPEDANDLVEVLSDAFEAQGICYGWDVSISSEFGSDLGDDIGSNNGVGVAADEAPCTTWVIFSAILTYTDESSESADSATFDVTSNVPGGPTRDDLERLGISQARLLGNNDDLALAEAARALPLLAAESGIVEPVPLEANADALPEGDGATGSHGSDWRRANGAPLALGILLALFGLGCIVFTLLSPTTLAERLAQLTPPTATDRQDPFDDR